MAEVTAITAMIHIFILCLGFSTLTPMGFSLGSPLNPGAPLAAISLLLGGEGGRPFKRIIRQKIIK
jgi:hypothetical protein